MNVNCYLSVYLISASAFLYPLGSVLFEVYGYVFFNMNLQYYLNY